MTALNKMKATHWDDSPGVFVVLFLFHLALDSDPTIPVSDDNVHVIEAFDDQFDLETAGFVRVTAKATGQIALDRVVTGHLG